jgi:hypothetical protein
MGKCIQIGDAKYPISVSVRMVTESSGKEMYHPACMDGSGYSYNTLQLPPIYIHIHTWKSVSYIPDLVRIDKYVPIVCVYGGIWTLHNGAERCFLMR